MGAVVGVRKAHTEVRDDWGANREQNFRANGYSQAPKDCKYLIEILRHTGESLDSPQLQRIKA